MMQREHVGAPKKRFSQDKLWLMFMISRTRLSQNTMISSVNSRPENMNCFCFMMGGKLSKELNHFCGIVSFFQDWAPGTLTGGK